MNRLLLMLLTACLTIYLPARAQEIQRDWELGLIAARVDLNGIGRTATQADLKGPWGIFVNRALGKSSLMLLGKIEYGEGSVGQITGTNLMEVVREIKGAIGVRRDIPLFSSARLHLFIESNLIFSYISIRQIEPAVSNFISVSSQTLGSEAYAGISFLPLDCLRISLCSGGGIWHRDKDRSRGKRSYALGRTYDL